MPGPRSRFRSRLHEQRLIAAPGAYDALTALLVERAGFEAVYLTGSGVAYTHLGAPDLGLVTETEMRDRLWQITDRVDLPVIADADTGYGGLLNVGRTVRDYERAGAAALQIEDQTFPKRCGHYANKSVVPIEEMLARVRAALDARVDPDLQIIGRTDALATSGFDVALERANLMVAEGVDVAFVEAPTDAAQLARIPAAVSAPVLVNIVEGGRTPNVPLDQLEQWGYRIAIFPNMITRTVVRAAQTALDGLRRDGRSRVDAERMVDFDELSALVGLPEATRLEERLTHPDRSHRVRGR